MGYLGNADEKKRRLKDLNAIKTLNIILLNKI